MNKQKLTIGILAHVDAGKTTLSEGILYQQGSIRELGRVDHRNAFLDTFQLERERGITIFSKQALFMLKHKEITLLDTPGHVDFSAEMERTLQVLDYGILVINGADGIQGHTATLWRLLKSYRIPVFLFVNKMDQAGSDRKRLMKELESRLDGGCLDFGADIKREVWYENLAMCDEKLLEEYLAAGHIKPAAIAAAVARRKVFPCYFGSALKLAGVEALLTGIEQYTQEPAYGTEFGARVFKITRDRQGSRLTHMKITGGSLKVKDVLTEKVDQIRIYSGEKYDTVSEAGAGTICAVTGLSRTYAGEGLGTEASDCKPLLQPVLTYRMILPPACDVHQTLVKLRQLEEEEPQLQLAWEEQTDEIHVRIMGEVEIEILQRLIQSRFDIAVEFDSGSLVYKETIKEPVIGIGHFEPLRHYAEVHLLMEPGEPGSGLVFDCDCSEDVLSRNWQRLVLTHLQEKRHKGVLTGAEITDMKLTLIAGRAHQKHTEGGDFRQATYRAVRQGLMKAESILLEPVYEFRLEVPAENTGRALADIQRMQGRAEVPAAGEVAVITGYAPAAKMRNYQMEVNAYSRGHGKLFCTLSGYEPCHNEAEMIAAAGYDAESDPDHPAGSVFCSHGAGFVVAWDKVEEYKHVESSVSLGAELPTEDKNNMSSRKTAGAAGTAITEEEIKEIFERTYGPIKRELYQARSRSGAAGGSVPEPVYQPRRPRQLKDNYLLVDGYNIIYAWQELKELAQCNLDSARYQLMDILCDYQAIRQITLIVVFDAYKVEGNPGKAEKYHNIHVVYTKEAETADQYIEKTVHQIGHKHNVTVATSDALEQMIVWGDGAGRLSAQGLKEEIAAAKAEIRSRYLEHAESGKHYPFKDVGKELE